MLSGKQKTSTFGMAYRRTFSRISFSCCSVFCSSSLGLGSMSDFAANCAYVWNRDSVWPIRQHIFLLRLEVSALNTPVSLPLLLAGAPAPMSRLQLPCWKTQAAVIVVVRDPCPGQSSPRWCKSKKSTSPSFRVMRSATEHDPSILPHWVASV